MSRKGSLGFDEYYAQIYGERWSALRAALLEPVQQVARPNGFIPASVARARFQTFPIQKIMSISTFRLPIQGDVAVGPMRPEPLLDGLYDAYFMDPASIMAAKALEVQSGDDVLDMCAAPGGKSLILAEGIADAGNLTSNEMSDRRRARLRAVIEDYVPLSVRSRVRVTGHDSARWCLHETDAYDRILVDAPCSGERHLLQNYEELKQWSPGRSKNLAVRQYALLASALAVVKAGGRIVYSTCSISPVENDAVIRRLLKKRNGQVKVVPFEGEFGEPTEMGWIVLPDATGFGPLYFSIIEKLP